MEESTKHQLIKEASETTGTEAVISWLKERANSGFLFTYLIYWVYFNWEFTILILFDSKPDGVGKILEFIKGKSEFEFRPWCPLFLGIISTAIWPFIAYLLKFCRHKAYQCYHWLIEKSIGIPPSSNQEIIELRKTISSREQKWLEAINRVDGIEKSMEYFKTQYDHEIYEHKLTRQQYEIWHSKNNFIEETKLNPRVYEAVLYDNKIIGNEFSNNQIQDLVAFHEKEPKYRIELCKDFLKIGNVYFNILSITRHENFVHGLLMEGREIFLFSSYLHERFDIFDIINLNGDRKQYIGLFKL